MLESLISVQNKRFLATRDGLSDRARLAVQVFDRRECQLAFIVNSSPGAGLRFEPSNTLTDMKAALDWAAGLSQRGMRLIRIRDTDTGRIFDERQLREEIKRLQEAA